ncbi:MAG: PQQ-like beta-propeller repeat protein [Verrucomicrobiae bacterium]|nr:PQQ-like beta-propeller repeat protein [Verrucomicrobiae bacterium]
MNIKLSIIGLTALVITASIYGADWNQYRGANSDGISTEKINPAKLEWSGNSPRTLWKAETPNGFSSFSIAGGKAYIVVSRNVDGQPSEVCVAFDAETGKELWAKPLTVAKYQSGGDSGTPDNKGGDGPRSTPAVSDGCIYVSTPKLLLYCLDANTGNEIWKKDIMQEFAGRNIGWENAASPVVDGDLVFFAGGGAGQSLIAFNKRDGSVVWKGFDERITHSTPTVATIHGVRQVIFFLQSGLLSVEAKTGRELWRFPFRFNVSTAISPVVCGEDLVYCSAGYDVGSGLCRIVKDGDKFKTETVWKIPGNKPVCNQWSTPVYKDGYLYGMFTFKEYGSGPFKCVEVATGKVMWEKPGFGMGNVILVDNKLIALADDGRVCVIEPTPKEYKEVTSAKILNGKCWSTPSFSNGRLYVRSTKEGACVDLK